MLQIIDEYKWIIDYENKDLLVVNFVEVPVEEWEMCSAVSPVKEEVVDDRTKQHLPDNFEISRLFSGAQASGKDLRVERPKCNWSNDKGVKHLKLTSHMGEWVWVVYINRVSVSWNI